MDPALAGSGVAGDLLTHLLDTALYLNGPVAEGIALSRTFVPGRAWTTRSWRSAFRERQRGHVRGVAVRDRLPQREDVSDPRVGRHAALQPRAPEPSGVRRRDDAADRAGTRDLLVTDLAHPIFPNFWRPGHIIGYEHTFIASLAEFLDCLSRGDDFHPNFTDGLAVQQRARRAAAAAIGQDAPQWTSRVTEHEGAHDDCSLDDDRVTTASSDGRSSALLAASITINLLDRQVLAVLASELRTHSVEQPAVRLHRRRLQSRHDARPDSGGALMDRVGTRIGLLAIFTAWSADLPAHALAGPGTAIESVAHALISWIPGCRQLPRACGLHGPAVPDGSRQCGNYTAGIKALAGLFPAANRSTRRRLLQRGRPVRFGHRAAAHARLPRPRSVSAGAWRFVIPAVCRHDVARPVVADLPRQGDDTAAIAIKPAAAARPTARRRACCRSSAIARCSGCS